MDCNDTIRVAGTVSDSITDGPGLRFTLFVQGCSHRCPGCHNPQAHDFAGGEPMPAGEILAKIRGNPLTRGVTLSGGEPFDQAEHLLCLASELVESGYELAAYSGYTFEEIVAAGGAKVQLLELCHVLVDGPYVEEQRTLAANFKGSKNQRILHVKESLAQKAAVELFDGRWQ